MERGSAAAAAALSTAAGAPSAKRMRISSADDQAEGAQDLHRMLLKEAAELDSSTTSSTSTSATSSSETTSSSSSSSSFEAVVQDEVRYRACRHAPLPPDVARTLQTKAEWGRGAAGTHQQRYAEEAVQRKQAELDRTNHLYKALARKSFQLSVTLLNQADVLQEEPQHAGARPPVPSSATTTSSHPSLSSSTPPAASGGTPPTTDIHRTIVLPAGTPHPLLPQHTLAYRTCPLSFPDPSLPTRTHRALDSHWMWVAVDVFVFFMSYVLIYVLSHFGCCSTALSLVVVGC
jgi:hypothetical protein